MKQPEEVLSLKQRLNKDIVYIKSEIMCEQNNGKLCKFSKAANGITVYDKSKTDFIKYWTQIYRSNKEYVAIIKQTCLDKLENGLISKEEMKKLIINCGDSEKEKAEILRKL